MTTTNARATLTTPPPSTKDLYVGKFEEGTTKYRILWLPATYYEFFSNENKPVRSALDFEQSYFEENCKEWDYWKQKNLVWALPAWDYQQKKQIVLELKKWALITELHKLANDTEDRWDPTKYDIKITRTWQKKETRYSLTATPPKAISKEIEEDLLNITVNVDVLIDNWNPFTKNVIDEGWDVNDSDETPEILKDETPF